MIASVMDVFRATAAVTDASQDNRGGRCGNSRCAATNVLAHAKFLVAALN
jgi:hypothetical protein